MQSDVSFSVGSGSNRFTDWPFLGVSLILEVSWNLFERTDGWKNYFNYFSLHDRIEMDRNVKIQYLTEWNTCILKKSFRHNSYQNWTVHSGWLILFRNLTFAFFIKATDVTVLELDLGGNAFPFAGPFSKMGMTSRLTTLMRTGHSSCIIGTWGALLNKGGTSHCPRRQRKRLSEVK